VAEMTAADAVEAPEQISALPRQLELPEADEA
jgi:hypothetical protein